MSGREKVTVTGTGASLRCVGTIRPRPVAVRPQLAQRIPVMPTTSESGPSPFAPHQPHRVGRCATIGVICSWKAIGSQTDRYAAAAARAATQSEQQRDQGGEDNGETAHERSSTRAPLPPVHNPKMLSACMCVRQCMVIERFAAAL